MTTELASKQFEKIFFKNVFYYVQEIRHSQQFTIKMFGQFNS